MAVDWEVGRRQMWNIIEGRARTQLAEMRYVKEGEESEN